MPTSVPGNSRNSRSIRSDAIIASRSRQAHARRGFTLLELLLVLAIVAISAGLATLALRDGAATRLEREAVRLAALLEMARAESRVSGTMVRWVPGADPTPQLGRGGRDDTPPPGFRFVGLSGQAPLPTHWMDAAVTAQVAAPGWLLLGPDAILPRQRVLLRLDDQSIEVVSDGLGPFTVAPAGGELP